MASDLEARTCMNVPIRKGKILRKLKNRLSQEAVESDFMFVRTGIEENTSHFVNHAHPSALIFPKVKA